MAKRKNPRPATRRRRQPGAAAPTTATMPWRWRAGDALFAADRPRLAGDGEHWTYFWPLLGAALLLRAAIALWGDFVLHPDEIMQYLEPAHYVAFGNGVLYWEYLHGARSWLIPGAIAGVLKALDGLGLAQPAIYIAVVKLLFCLLSLSVPWAMYRFTQITVNERSARLALIFGCFWYELAALAHKPFTELFSTSIFMVVLALSVGREAERPARLFAIGLLAALSGAVRLQYAPVALLLLLLRSVSLRNGVAGLVSLWAGAGLLTLLVGIFEWQTWGAPFHSYLSNFFINLAIDPARAGESSRWLLLGQLAAASGGMALIAFAAALPRGRRHLLILVTSAVILVLHLLPEHREYRFIHVLIPCWLMLLAAWIARWGDGLSGERGRISALARRWGAAAVLAFGIPALLNAFPWQSRVYQSFSVEKPVYYLRNQDPIFEIMSFLAAQDDVHGALYHTREYNAYFSTGGYYYLHHDVPFYTAQDTWQTIRERHPAVPQESLVSHIVTEADGPAIQGFERLLRRGNLALWRRRDNDSAVPRWREHVIKVSHADLNDLVSRTMRRLNASSMLDLFVADDLYWVEAPPLFESADE